jgi:hypothetical protein
MPKFASQAEWDPKAEVWKGLDGPLHPDDHAKLNETLRKQLDAELSEMKSMQLSRPQTYDDFLASADHLREIRRIERMRDALVDGDD